MKRQRMITAIILISILIPLISIPELLSLFQIVMILFVVFASRELLNMFEQKESLTPLFKTLTIVLTVSIYISIAGFLGFNQTDKPFNPTLLMAIIPLIVVSLLVYFVLSSRFKVEHIGKALLVMVYIGFGGAAIAVLRFLGVRYIIYMALVSTMTDTFAYVIGMRFGKSKLAPSISPKKSWEGSIGGTIFATVIASGFALFYGDLFPQTSMFGDIINYDGLKTMFDTIITNDMSFIVLSVIVVLLSFTASIVSQFGDLFASKLKRHYEIKDYGNIFPGHGGIMDRFDSIIMVSLYMSSVIYVLTLLL